MKRKFITCLLLSIYIAVVGVFLTGCGALGGSGGHEHPLEHTTAKAATCLEKGNIEYYYCSQCHKYFADDKGKQTLTKNMIEIGSLGHDYGDWTQAKAATCSAYGEKVRRCNRCEYTDTKYLSLLPHTEVIDPRVESTCTTKGKTEGSHCSVCHAVIREQYDLALNSHDYQWEITTAVTCTTDGTKVGTCSVCGDVVENVINHEGHHFNIRVDGQTATCEAEGVKDNYKCTQCDALRDSDTVIPKLPHTPSAAYVVQQAATCITDGYECKECIKCGATVGDEVVIPATSIHNFVNRECTSCHYDVDHYQTESINLSENPLNDDIKAYIVPLKDGTNMCYIYGHGQMKNNAYIANRDNISCVYCDGDIDNLGNELFINATKLQKVVLNPTLKVIGEGVFKGCTSLGTLTIPSSVVSVAKEAFQSCTNLYTTTNKIHYVSNWAVGAINLSSDVLANDRNPGKFTLKSGCNIADYAFANNTLMTEISIPSDVGVIGVYACKGCSKLTKANFPNTKDTIPEGLFQECTKLSNLTLGNNLQTIGAYAFASCIALTDAAFIPSNVTTLGYSAFSRCNGLTSVIIPDKVVTIGNYCFEACWYLQTVNIKGNVTTIGDFAFYDCKKLVSMVISGGISQAINIPKSVTTIGQGVFQKCTSMTKLSLHNQITDIGIAAFSGCTALAHISLNGTSGFPNVTSLPDGVFRDCASLTSFTIPNSVTALGNNVFNGCQGLTTLVIPDTVQSIGTGVLTGCSKIISLTVPFVGANDHDTTNNFLGYFFGATSLDTCLTKVPSASLTTLVITGGVLPGTNGFAGCSKLTNLTLPDNQTYSVVADYLFYNCSALTSFPLSATVTKIGIAGFQNCRHLTAINLSTVTDLQASALEGTGITTVTLNNTLPQLPNRAFALCTALSNVNIPATVTILGDEVFFGCTNLTNMTVSDNVTKIGHDIFGDCCRLATLTLPFLGGSITDTINAKLDYTFHDPDQKTLHTLTVNHVNTLAASACQNYSALTTINLPDTYTAIGSQAFSGCASLSALTIPNTVTTIGDQAFFGCSQLSTMTFPDTVTAIGFGALQGCFGLTELTTPFLGGTSATSNDGKTIGYLFGNTDYLQNATYLPTNLTTVTINSTDRVTLNDGAFYLCTKLTTFTITYGEVFFGAKVFFGCDQLTAVSLDKLQAIASDAFNGCLNLQTFTVKRGLTAIGARAFKDCAALTTVSFCDTTLLDNNFVLRSIGASAFANCTHLTSFTIPASVSDLYSGTFQGCSALTSVTFAANAQRTSVPDAFFADCHLLNLTALPDNLTTIGNRAFANCQKLNVTIPNTVTHIGEAAFSGCTSLTGTISFSNNFQPTGLGAQAFFGCTNVTEFILPATLTTLPAQVFAGCAKATSIAPLTYVTQIDDGAFANCAKLATVDLPNGVILGAGVFTNCANLTTLDFSTAQSPNSNYLYLDAQMVQGCTKLTELVTGNTVTGLADACCANLTSLQIVTLGSRVTYLPPRAFANCTNLVTVSSSATKLDIGNYAFQNCKHLLRTQTANNVFYVDGTVGTGAFANCTALMTVDFRSHPTILGSGAFAGCAALTTVTLPNTLTSIPDTLFKDCSNLTTVYNFADSNTITTIGDEAFFNCRLSSTFDLPTNKLTTIGAHAFGSASAGNALTTVTIGAKVTSIGMGAFARSGVTNLAFADTDHGWQGTKDNDSFALNTTQVADGNFMATLLRRVDAASGTAGAQYAWQKIS